MFGHHWESGEATVIACQEEYSFIGFPDDPSARDYVLDVRPAAGTSVFRTQVRQTYTSWKSSRRERSLLAGEVIAVLCDPKHQKAKLDESDPHLYADGQVPGKGHDSPPIETPFEAAAAAPPGTPAPAGASSELAGALGGGQIAPVQPRIDVADQLAKLAGLRDSGVLTAAEFEAQKQKLLGA